jgi:hypothetical protein
MHPSGVVSWGGQRFRLRTDSADPRHNFTPDIVSGETMHEGRPDG